MILCLFDRHKAELSINMNILGELQYNCAFYLKTICKLTYIYDNAFHVHIHLGMEKSRLMENFGDRVMMIFFF